MSEARPTTDVIAFPSDDARDMLTPILREGAQKMLATAIELEAHAWIEERACLRDENGRRLAVRNGHQGLACVNAVSSVAMSCSNGLGS